MTFRQVQSSIYSNTLIRLDCSGVLFNAQRKIVLQTVFSHPFQRSIPARKIECFQGKKVTHGFRTMC